MLTKGEYCVVLDPVGKDGRPQLGKREVRIGVASFFLHPGMYNIKLQLSCQTKEVDLFHCLVKLSLKLFYFKKDDL